MARSKVRAGGYFRDPNARALPRHVQIILGVRSSLALGSSRTPKGAVYPWAISGRRSYPNTVDKSRSTFRTGLIFPSIAKPARAKLMPSLVRLRAAMPARVKFCVMRKVRREVLFANRFAGSRGHLRGKRIRRTINSSYSCR